MPKFTVNKLEFELRGGDRQDPQRDGVEWAAPPLTPAGWLLVNKSWTNSWASPSKPGVYILVCNSAQIREDVARLQLSPNIMGG